MDEPRLSLLPGDALALILAFLDPPSLLPLFGTCRWCLSALPPQLRGLALSNRSSSLALVQLVAALSRNARRFSGCTSLALEVIDSPGMDGGWLTEALPGVLRHWQHLPRLTSLSLLSASLSEAATAALYALPRLQHLALRDCTLFAAPQGSALAPPRWASTLHALALIDTSGAEHLAACLQQGSFPALRNLTCMGWEWRNKTLGLACSTLRSLALMHPLAQEEDLTHLRALTLVGLPRLPPRAASLEELQIATRWHALSMPWLEGCAAAWPRRLRVLRLESPAAALPPAFLSLLHQLSPHLHVLTHNGASLLGGPAAEAARAAPLAAPPSTAMFFAPCPQSYHYPPVKQLLRAHASVLPYLAFDPNSLNVHASPRAALDAYALRMAQREQLLSSQVLAFCPLRHAGCPFYCSSGGSALPSAGVAAHLKSGQCSVAEYVCMTCGRDAGAARAPSCAAPDCAEVGRGRQLARAALAPALPMQILGLWRMFSLSPYGSTPLHERIILSAYRLHHQLYLL